MLCGGSESAQPLGVGGFASMKASAPQTTGPGLDPL